MKIKVITRIDGVNKLVVGASIYVREYTGTVETDDYIFVEDTDLPVSFELFCENVDKFEVVAGAVVLISGAIVNSRYIDPLDVDSVYPLALNRANKATIFNNL